MLNCILGAGKGEEEKVVGLELGSLVIVPELRGHHLAEILVSQLVTNLDNRFKHLPIFAVVTADNGPSNQLFRRLGWEAQELKPEETDNFTKFFINDVNILAGWGKPSIIYWCRKK